MSNNPLEAVTQAVNSLVTALKSESGTATDCGFPGAGKGPAGCIAGC